MSDEPQTSAQLDWDESFRRRTWDYLAEIGETPRYALVAGYIHKLVARGRILDAGCGEGILIDYLDLGRISYRGFDVSATAVDRARRRSDAAQLTACAVEHFTPPDDERYDVVVFNEVLAVLERPVETAERFAGFLAPSGYLIVSQFQGSHSEANASKFSRTLEGMIEAGRYRAVAGSEVQDRVSGLRWRIFCLQPNPSTTPL